MLNGITYASERKLNEAIPAGEGAFVRQFSSDVAHELRSPLMALQGELDIARHDGAIDHDVHARTTVLLTRLATRVDDLVLLSVLDERAIRPRRVVSLREVVVEEASFAGGEVQVAGDDALVDVDVELLGRAVRNLLANARRHARARVQAVVVAERGGVWAHVDDDGAGISTAERSRVFERFTRLDAARTDDAGGAGLGLAIVASVARAHDGTVVAGESPFGGARLSLWLPVPLPV